MKQQRDRQRGKGTFSEVIHNPEAPRVILKLTMFLAREMKLKALLYLCKVHERHINIVYN